MQPIAQKAASGYKGDTLEMLTFDEKNCPTGQSCGGCLTAAADFVVNRPNAKEKP